ncbi:tryptophan halogenase family protein [Sphingomonas lacusdianchii]|uniref:tryptophan halogenase family protein n=1 Tax=Sphingomonas lacusdianchii TaxID=2917992 RepID=UPI001F59F8EC|nr:tryptophan halogenase family protein [Sphingomonas sp. JXJ CY 53]
MTDNRIRQIVVLGGGSAGWMAAAALATYLGRGISVRLVESEEVGIVGVGESSVPHMKTFNSETLGIDERDFVTRTNSTFKLGIRFTDWGRVGNDYIHGFGTIGRGLGPLPFHQLWLKRFLAGRAGPLGDYSLQTVAAPAGKFQWSGPPDTPLADIAYAYHLDAVLYARFLRELAERRGVERIEGKVVRVEQDGGSGHVQAIVLDDGQRIDGEFFIDCSGFRGVLIEQTLKTGYLDWRHWLPCDRAFAVPSASVGPPTPYTEAAARPAGWQWRIPLQHRVGNGYVYSSAYESDEQAIATLLGTLQGKALDVPRQLRFTAGRRARAWNGNVIALGLAAGFLEPLESTGIYLAQAGIRRLLGLFPGRDIDPALADRFNRETAFEYERTRDFLVLHYKATTRDDTPFWRYCRTMDVPDPLREAIDLFRTDGRYFRNGEDFFALPSWVQVMIGQGIVPADYHPIVDAMPEGHLDQYLARVRVDIASAVATMPPHDQFIDHHCKASVA